MALRSGACRNFFVLNVFQCSLSHFILRNIMSYQSINTTLLKYDLDNFSVDHLMKVMPEILAWIDSYGLSSKDSRYSKYENIINEFYEMKTPFETDAVNKFSRLSESILECFDIFFIYKSFKNEKSEGFRERLKKAVRGIDLVDNNTEDESRNFLFELLVASEFERKKYVVDFDNITDIIASNDKYCIFAECKRIRSKKQLIKRIDNACRQIESRTKCNEAYNLVFIDITSCLFDDIEKKEFKSTAEACSNREMTICKFLNSKRESIISTIDKYENNISAFCAMHRSLIWVDDNNNISSFYYTSKHMRVPTKLSDEKLENLCEIMKST